MPKTGRKKKKGLTSVFPKKQIQPKSEANYVIIPYEQHGVCEHQVANVYARTHIAFYKLGLVYDCADDPCLELVRNKYKSIAQIRVHFQANPLDVNRVFSTGANFMHLAAFSGRADVVRLMLEEFGAGNLVNQAMRISDSLKLDKGDLSIDLDVPVTPLMLAVFAKRTNVLKVFADYKKAHPGWDIDVECYECYPNSQSCLQHAVAYAPECVDALIALGANVCSPMHVRDSADIYTPFSNALRMNQPQLVKKMLVKVGYQSQGHLNRLKTEVPDVLLSQKVRSVIAEYDLKAFKILLRMTKPCLLDFLGEQIKAHFVENPLSEALPPLVLYDDIFSNTENTLLAKASYYALYGMIDQLKTLMTEQPELAELIVSEESGLDVMHYALLGADAATIDYCHSHLGKALDDPERKAAFELDLLRTNNEKAILVGFALFGFTFGQSLHYAIANNFTLPTLEVMIEKSDQINVLDEDGDTVLTSAIKAGNVEFVDLLLSSPEAIENDEELETPYQALVNLSEGAPKSQLYRVLILGHQLIECPAATRAAAGAGSAVQLESDRYCTLDEQFSALALACLEGNKRMVEHYLEQTPMLVWQRTTYGETPLHLAVRSLNTKVVEQILKHTYTNANTSNSFGETPLMIAVANGDLENTRLLLSYVNLDQVQDNIRGLKPLQMIVEKPCLHELLDEIDSTHCNLDIVNELGDTPLLELVKAGHFTAALTMVENLADVTIRNQAGFDAEKYLLDRWPVIADYTPDQSALLDVIRAEKKKTYLHAQAMKLQTEVEALKEQVELKEPKTNKALLAKNRELQQKIKEQQTLIAQLSSALDNFEQRSYKALVAELEEKMDPRDVERLKQEKTQLNKRLQETNNQRAHQKQRFDKEKAALLERIAALETKVAQKDKDISEVVAQRDALPTLDAMLTLNQEKEALQTQLRNVKTQLTVAREKIAELTKAYQGAPVVTLLEEKLQSAVAKAVKESLKLAHAPIDERLKEMEASATASRELTTASFTAVNNKLDILQAEQERSTKHVDTSAVAVKQEHEELMGRIHFLTEQSHADAVAGARATESLATAIRPMLMPPMPMQPATYAAPPRPGPTY